MFLSNFQNKVDQKGRVSIPAPYRTALAGQKFNGIVVLPSFRFDMLEGYGIDYMEEMKRQLNQLPKYSEEYDRVAALFGEATALPFDGEGRVLLPKPLLDHAKITDTVGFYGVGDNFEFWSPVALEERRALLRAQQSEKGMTLQPFSKVTAQ